MTAKMTPEIARTLSAAEQHEWFRSVTSRRSLLRGGLVGAGAVAAGPTLLSGVSSAATSRQARPAAALLQKADRSAGAAVTPFGRHVAFGASASQQMSVSWQVPALINNPFIRVGRTPWDLGHRVEADLRVLTTPQADIDSVTSVPPSDTGPVVQYYLQAALSGLRPGETYFYVVGHDGWDAPGHLDTIRSFTTAPLGRSPFTFTAFGDQGVTYNSLGNANLIRAQNPAFHLHAGDISYAEDGGDGLITDSYDPQIWNVFLNQVEPVASSVPWQIAAGNHEMETWYSPNGYGGLFDRFALPGSTTYYSFVYGNVMVISLDANDVSDEIPANNGYTAGGQTAWLASQLAAARSRSDIDFVVAYFHHCAYCTCTVHGSEGGVRANWTALFDQYSVDLVINGHNHIYERTDPIKGGSATTAAPIGSTIKPATQGTTYITAGGGGQSLYTFSAPDSYEGNINNDSAVPSYVNEPGGTTMNETVAWSRVRFTGYCLLVVESTPAWRGGTSRLKIRGLSEDGTELDQIVLARKAG
jgi:purple acid phosphatase-like protein/calcineurin-like phosphoesterase family protein